MPLTQIVQIIIEGIFTGYHLVSNKARRQTDCHLHFLPNFQETNEQE